MACSPGATARSGPQSRREPTVPGRPKVRCIPAPHPLPASRTTAACVMRVPGPSNSAASVATGRCAVPDSCQIVTAFASRSMRACSTYRKDSRSAILVNSTGLAGCAPRMVTNQPHVIKFVHIRKARPRARGPDYDLGRITTMVGPSPPRPWAGSSCRPARPPSPTVAPAPVGRMAGGAASGTPTTRRPRARGPDTSWPAKS